MQKEKDDYIKLLEDENEKLRSSISEREVLKAVIGSRTMRFVDPTERPLARYHWVRK